MSFILYGDQTVIICCSFRRPQQVVWYTERTVTQLSLGGLLILVVIRTIQYNMVGS